MKPVPRITKLEVDSKFNTFWAALQEILSDNSTSKVIIFALFRGTIEHLHKQLRQRGVLVEMIHGGYKVEEHNQAIDNFRGNPDCRVRISSDVGSEGLDFQFCDTIFNYDLPWNPMKVEQRIGRIDRFRQKSETCPYFQPCIGRYNQVRILLRLQKD